MNLKDFDYILPPELIAKFPAVNRTESKLLKYSRRTKQVEHSKVKNLVDFLSSGDTLIFNDTRVLAARLQAQKETGGIVEILIEKILNDKDAIVLIGSNKPVKEKQSLYGHNFSLEIIEKREESYYVTFKGNRDIYTILKEEGSIPLPPYIDRPISAIDKERYQTVFSKKLGAIAAPTAGLHFDELLLKKLQDIGVKIGFITLHVGTGTFKPVRVNQIDKHKMNKEYIQVSEETCEIVNTAKSRGNKVIAVGTTVVRALESAWKNGKLQPYSGDTELFIYPGYKFSCIDELMTNFHLPGSTLLMLVSAFVSRKEILDLYQIAIENKYRFYSYGDLMYISQ